MLIQLALKSHRGSEYIVALGLATYAKTELLSHNKVPL